MILRMGVSITHSGPWTPFLGPPFIKCVDCIKEIRISWFTTLTMCNSAKPSTIVRLRHDWIGWGVEMGYQKGDKPCLSNWLWWIKLSNITSDKGAEIRRSNISDNYLKSRANFSVSMPPPISAYINLSLTSPYACTNFKDLGEGILEDSDVVFHKTLLFYALLPHEANQS